MIEDKKSNDWIVYLLDLGIFFILLFIVGGIGAFVISGVVATILHYVINSNDKFNKFLMLLKFEKDELLFESKTSEKPSFRVSFKSINNVKDIKLEGSDGKQILISTNEEDFIFQLSNFNIEIFNDLINKLNKINMYDSIVDNNVKKNNSSIIS